MTIETREQVNATKNRKPREAALELLDGIRQLYVAKGKKVVHVDLAKEEPADDELAALLLGPSGNLRAPTLRKGKTLAVGFHADMYNQLFG